MPRENTFCRGYDKSLTAPILPTTADGSDHSVDGYSDGILPTLACITIIAENTAQ